MSKNLDVVKRCNEAALKKDFDTIKQVLHPNYTLKGPMMSINSADEFIAFMKDCPGECTFENVQFIEAGDKIVQTFDMVMTAPTPSRARVCSVMTLENGKIRSEEMFYDTKDMPQDSATSKPGKNTKAA